MPLFTIDIDEQFRLRMAQLAGELNAAIRQRIEQIPREMAESAYYKATELANSKLHSTAQDYIDNLDYEQIAPGVWSVYLKEGAEHLETGYERFDMKPGLLRNAKKISKAGYPYRSIPMFNSGKGNQSQGDMMKDLKNLRKEFGDNGITKNDQGEPLLGKIFSIGRTEMGIWQLQGKQPGVGNQSARLEASQHLAGVTKYQYQIKGRGGKMTTKAQFVTFRTVSADPKYAAKWIHPGFAGAQIFPELMRWAEQALDRIMEDMFR